MKRSLSTVLFSSFWTLGILFVLALGVEPSQCARAAAPEPASRNATSCTLGSTLALVSTQADIVIVGVCSVKKATKSIDSATPKRQTIEFQIHRVVKAHRVLSGKTRMILQSRDGDETKCDGWFVLFADAIKGQVEPYRAIPCVSKADAEEWAKYLRKVLRLFNSRVEDKLAFHFKHLGSRIDGIATDSWLVFCSASFESIVSATGHYRRDSLVSLLSDKRFAAEQRGLFALLLGVCGCKQDAHVFRQLLKSDVVKELIPNMNFWQLDGRIGIEGALVGYSLLEPERGVEHLLATLGDGSQPRELRLASVGALRFLLGHRYHRYFNLILEKLPKKPPSSDSITPVLIDTLRSLELWQALDKLIALVEIKDSSDRKTLLALAGFALKCPGDKPKRILERLRLHAPETVREAEEHLRNHDP